MVKYRRPYQCADGFVCVLPYNTKQWRAFFQAMQRPELRDDPRVTDPRLRSEKIGELYALVAECVAGWKTDALLDALQAADVPNGRATPLGELAEDEHLKAVGLFRHYDHPTEGRIRLAGPGIGFSRTPAEIRTLPPVLGEHSLDVLREAGLDDARIEAMLAEGATRDGRPETARRAAE